MTVGNKCDLEDDRQVQKAQAQSVAEKYKWTWIEASAKNKINVTETFQEIVRCIRKYRNSAVTADGEDKATEKPAAKARRVGCLLL